jgi:predicted MFS family arabinose efflux permease
VLVVVLNLGIAAGALVGGGVIEHAGVALLPVSAVVAAAAAEGRVVLGRWAAVRRNQRLGGRAQLATTSRR